METNDNSSDSLASIKLKEQFVHGLNGTTMGEVLLFTLQIPLLLFVTIFLEVSVLYRIIIDNFKMLPNDTASRVTVFLLEAITIVLPVVLMFTVLSDYLHITCVLVVCFTIFIITRSVSSIDDQVLYWKWPNLRKALLLEIPLSRKQLFITYFRSFVFLVTAISILGVDFHVYPRRFAKTETYGVSLMDLGVGLYIVSNALVAKRSISLQELRKTLLESMVLIILGILRYALIQGFGYQKHITEYGLHWNFFITLACVKILSSLILKLSKGHSFICGLSLALIHQYFLSFSLESFVLGKNERDDWFSANREGIVSLCGFVGLYLIGISVANLVNPLDKSLTLMHKFKTVILLNLISVVLFCVLYYFDIKDFKVSRRLANLPYILWITLNSLELIALSLLVELIAVFFLPVHPLLKNKIHLMLTPAILESINYNGLWFFLISNLLTGLLNLKIDAFNLEASSSVVILYTYMFLNCAIVFNLYIFNIRLKL